MPTVNLARERSLYQAFSEQTAKLRQTELAQYQEQLGTGRRINRPSDDASAYTQARQLELLGERYAQYERSINSARSWSDHTQAGLDHLAELFTQAYEQGVRFANGTHSADDRQSAVASLQSLMESVVDGLNAKAGGEYLFAGSRTTQKPFDLAGAVVTYAGNNGGRERHVGRDVTLDINIDGTRLFNTGSGFTVTEALSDLMGAVGTGDPTQLDTALTRIQTARDHIADLGADAGNTGKRLQVAQAQLDDAALLVEGRRSELEDIDLAETMVHVQQAQTGLQAALRVASTVLQTSLLDYLR